MKIEERNKLLSALEQNTKVFLLMARHGKVNVFKSLNKEYMQLIKKLKVNTKENER